MSIPVSPKSRSNRFWSLLNQNTIKRIYPRRVEATVFESQIIPTVRKLDTGSPKTATPITATPVTSTPNNTLVFDTAITSPEIEEIPQPQLVLKISLVGDGIGREDMISYTERVSKIIDLQSLEDMSLEFAGSTNGTVNINQPDGERYNLLNKTIVSTGYRIIDSYVVDPVLYVIIQKRKPKEESKVVGPEEYNEKIQHTYNLNASLTGMIDTPTSTANNKVSSGQNEVPTVTGQGDAERKAILPPLSHSASTVPTILPEHISTNTVIASPHALHAVELHPQSSQKLPTATATYVHGQDCPDIVIVNGQTRPITHSSLVARAMLLAQDLDSRDKERTARRKRCNLGDYVDSVIRDAGRSEVIKKRAQEYAYKEEATNIKPRADLPQCPLTIILNESAQDGKKLQKNGIPAAEKSKFTPPKSRGSRTSQSTKMTDYTKWTSEERTLRLNTILNQHWTAQKGNQVPTNPSIAKDLLNNEDIAIKRTPKPPKYASPTITRDSTVSLTSTGTLLAAGTPKNRLNTLSASRSPSINNKVGSSFGFSPTKKHTTVSLVRGSVSHLSTLSILAEATDEADSRSAPGVNSGPDGGIRTIPVMGQSRAKQGHKTTRIPTLLTRQRKNSVNNISAIRGADWLTTISERAMEEEEECETDPGSSGSSSGASAASSSPAALVESVAKPGNKKAEGGVPESFIPRVKGFTPAKKRRSLGEVVKGGLRSFLYKA